MLLCNGACSFELGRGGNLEPSSNLLDLGQRTVIYHPQDGQPVPIYGLAMLREIESLDQQQPAYEVKNKLQYECLLEVLPLPTLVLLFDVSMLKSTIM